MISKRIHFIGIGGASMSALAFILHKSGSIVSGSDIVKTKTTLSLKRQGIKVYSKHRKTNAKNVDIVVYTDAVSLDNPELVFALKNNIKVLKRSELLSLIASRYKTSIAIAGCHGKTTTTALLGKALTSLSPTVHMGGQINKQIVTIGKGDAFITEACEYKRNFLTLNPNILIVLNIETDHMDCYDNLTDLQNTYKELCRNIKDGGTLIVNGDDENCKPLLEIPDLNIITFGFNENNNYYAKSVKENLNSIRFDLYFNNEKIDEIKLNIGLKHNVYNSLAVIAVSRLLNATDTKQNLLTFYGVDRRNQLISLAGGINVYHDYAHHPTEIQKIIKEHKGYCKGKLFVVFEPHTYSRTQKLFKEFSVCFYHADEVLMLPIYAAREKPIDGVSSIALAEETNSKYFDTYKQAKKFLKRHIRQGDEILILGAGNIYKLAEMFKA